MKPLVLGQLIGVKGRMRQQVLTIGRVLLIHAVLCLFLIACRPVSSPSPNADQTANQTAKLTIASTSFANGAAIPPLLTCDGKNRSPDLSWEGIPPNTQSLALIAEDPDAPGKTFTHWVLYDLPPKTRQLPAGLPPQPFLTTGGGHGKNDFGRYGYGGPCPKSGTHRYLFKLYALDKLLDLPAGATKAEVLEAMEGHVIAMGELMGTYSRKK
jgi:Raf kinase inhibitor-like YbhB/YbcL family protein